jgi:glutathione S-transferase
MHAPALICEMAMPAPLKLISHKLCPYVQRAVIALTEKGVGFERIDIDLANKPDWFLAISPLGIQPDRPIIPFS